MKRDGRDKSGHDPQSGAKADIAGLPRCAQMQTIPATLFLNTRALLPFRERLRESPQFLDEERRDRVRGTVFDGDDVHRPYLRPRRQDLQAPARRTET